jgi:hypothetical protein
MRSPMHGPIRPYEINLLEPSIHDRQFTAADLEAVLRQYDVDAMQLPGRLRELLNLTNLENARLVTTHSFDPPVPGTALFSDVADQYRGQRWSIQELLSLRLLAETDPPPENAIPGLLKHLMPSELLLGQRFDINRPLGNARDDTPAGNAGHGLVDEQSVSKPERSSGKRFGDESRTDGIPERARLPYQRCGCQQRQPIHLGRSSAGASVTGSAYLCLVDGSARRKRPAAGRPWESVRGGDSLCTGSIRHQHRRFRDADSIMTLSSLTFIHFGA